MKAIYCISGLAADRRVFSPIDFGEHEVHFLPWKVPDPKDTIEQYAAKMAEGIHHQNPILIGLSFGGIMANELSKLIPTGKIIILSSIKSRKEMPGYMKIASRLSLHKLVHLRPWPFLEPFQNYNLGVRTPEQKSLAREYRQKADQGYLDWAIDKILNWENEYVPDNLVQIHGSKDHIFPLKYVKPDHIIPDGGHLFLMNQWQLTNKILKQYL